MMRLKSREKWVPGGFQVLHLEAGQKEPFSGSFSEAVRFEVNFRGKNPGICAKNGWSSNVEEVELFVEDYNARRCVAGGWLNFVALDVESPEISNLRSQISEQPAQKKSWSSLAAGVSRVADGARLLVDWLGDGQAPVSVEIAERRAAVCAGCPRNDGGGWEADFTAPIAGKNRPQKAVRHDLGVRAALGGRVAGGSAGGFSPGAEGVRERAA